MIIDLPNLNDAHLINICSVPSDPLESLPWTNLWTTPLIRHSACE